MHLKVSEAIKIDSEIDGKIAITDIEPLVFYKIKGEIYTLVEAKPFTGRTHQIRIHLNKINHPIVGDKIYGNTESDYFKNKNLYLFSGGVEFNHPISGEENFFKIPLPKRFRNLNNYKIS